MGEHSATEVPLPITMGLDGDSRMLECHRRGVFVVPFVLSKLLG
ncbi:MAG: hypothetical protein P8J89_05445 [Phycisphaerales bacterium]|nr:hypothetical protein [Phycisphaerales bacterium]